MDNEGYVSNDTPAVEAGGKTTMAMRIDALKSTINSGQEDEMSITGYRKSTKKSMLTWIGYILTIGFLRLVFYWKPDWFVKATHDICSLQDADKVLLQDVHRQIWVESVKEDPVSPALAYPSRLGKTGSSMQEASTTRYFMNKRVKYIWLEDLFSFDKLRGLETNVTCGFFHQTEPLSIAEQSQKRILYGANAIIVRVTPIIKLLFTEGLNPFYVFQLFSVTLWFVDEYVFYASAIVIMSTTSLAAQIYQTRAMQRALKHTITASGIVTVARDTGKYDEIPSEDLVPGDIIEVPRHGCIMQCDAALISGNCIVNESMLTGESVPVTKTPLPNPRALKGQKAVLYSVKEHSRHTLFCGTKVIQTRFYGNQRVKAVVIRTGFSTAKGELVRSILFPKPTDFKFSQDSFKFIGVLFGIAFIGMIYTYAIMISNGLAAKVIIIRSLDLITIVVPPALPAAMTIGIVFAQRRLKKRKIFCISPNSINQCGALNVYCFDKTGTLTEDGLDMWGAVPIEGSEFEPVTQDVHSLGRRPITCAMATCHSLTVIEGELCGDPLDLKMFEATGWDLEEQGEDTSKYDVFMPTVVRPKKPDLVASSETLNSEENLPFELGILRQFTFSSKLQRMSVIARTLGKSHFDLYAKGAPEMIASLCKPETVPPNFHDVLMQYTMHGYRVIALAWRQLKRMNYVKIQRAQREEVECKLTLLGLLVMENRLKPQTTPIIKQLKLAKIRPVMVTGDNMLTALSVARDCHMIEPKAKVILVQVLASSGLDGVPSEPRLQFSYAEDANERVQEVKTCHSNAINGSILVDAVAVEIDDPGRRVHFAMSGKSWALVRKHFCEVLPKLVVRGTVFARFSPDQKQQLIETMQKVGYYVGMCGDGANDCGALKTAHAGISLSEAEASVASPFTAKEPHIGCVPTLVMEGRAALVTSFSIFKYMACYSLTQFFSVCLLYWIGANLTDFGFLYIDLLLLTTLSITFAFTRAYPTIVPTPPEVSLISFQPIMSIICQMLWIIAIQLFAFFIIQTQPWFEPFVENDMDSYVSHTNTVVTLVSCYQYIILAVVFSKGSPYRMNVFTNYLFLANVAITLISTIWITIYPMEWVVNLMEFKMPPSIPFRALIVGVAAINFFVNFITETFFVDSRVGDKVQNKIHAKQNNLLSVYKTLENEMSTSVNWPPLSNHAASLADLMRLESDTHLVTDEDEETANYHDKSELLADGDDGDLGMGSTYERHRQVSECSFDNAAFMAPPEYDDKNQLMGESPPGAASTRNRAIVSPGKEAGSVKHNKYLVQRSESKESSQLLIQNGVVHTDHTTRL